MNLFKSFYMSLKLDAVCDLGCNWEVVLVFTEKYLSDSANTEHLPYTRHVERIGY